MTRIGNVDQVLLLLHEQLQRTSRNRGTARQGRTSRAEAASARPLDRVRALAALDTLDEEELRRAMVRGLLAEQFGEAVGNDPALIAIVDQVSRMIGETPEGRQLMDRALAQLRESRA
ncbi:hypothetical protein ACQKOH_08540 [Sphingomonas sp. NPDC092331]|jgi:hypothetical protein|uniref:hypothetical protein n=1 Tax=unclassified Sphingomonas TaxID=196159 RepID=UPI002453F0FA|nr:MULTISPECIES: hypothetical protein [unclassified Sphingomonas]MBQ1496678.1 hypothetical protein [Sphingomonas sp.]MCH7860350.1 hypothetical protein [Pseudomonadota bacterium]MDH4744526.1 hypothetical protein [Sphingomonas sp. CBMAI 2297]